MNTDTTNSTTADPAMLLAQMQRERAHFEAEMRDGITKLNHAVGSNLVALARAQKDVRAMTDSVDIEIARIAAETLVQK